MRRKQITIGLVAAVILQFAILVGGYVSAALPLWQGTEIRIATVPVDPRSLFRGNYARLHYDISRVQLPVEFPGTAIRHGEAIYVSLKQGENGLYSFAGASLEPPTEGVFIRGRNRSHNSRSGTPLQVEYGIEAFFAKKEQALALEKELRNGGVALLMVLPNGKAALKNVVPNPPAD